MAHHRRLPPLAPLDGLRAVAVTAVLLYHAGVLWMPGGFLGVEVFFVLSGYLITAGLWREWEDRHRIEAPRFWRRRARRLLPGLGVLLLAVAGAGVVFFRSDIAEIKGELAAACLYVSNWYLIAADLSYFSEIGRPSALRHLWSLAIEEQFYLLWPIVLSGLMWLLRRAWLIATATLALAASSVAVAWLIYSPGDDPSRVYYGTDTRAAALLLGAALALVWRPFERAVIRRSGATRLLDVVGLAGLAVIGWLALRANEFAPATYDGGIQIAALASAAVVAAGVHPGCRLTLLLLGGRALQAIGRRCYSIYLWHWPVFVVTRPGLDVPWSAAPTLALRIGITGVLAEVSYRWVEMPIRDGRVQAALARVQQHARRASPWRRRQMARAWGLMATASLVIVIAIVGSLVRATVPAPAFAAVPVSKAEPAGSTTTVALSPTTPAPPTTASAPPPPAAVPVPARIVAIGDSVLLGAAPAVLTALPGVELDASVSRQFQDAVGIVEARRAAGALGDAVIIHIGTNGPPMSGQFEQLLAAVAGVPRVVLVTVEVARRWEQQVNDMVRSTPPAYANVRIADWNQFVPSCPPGSLADDGVHLVGPGPACYAGLLAQTVTAP